MGIPTIRDRVVQIAAKMVLEAIFAADFDPDTCGYRPRRSAQDAIRKVHQLLCNGYTDVADADLSKYFNTIPHCELMQRRKANRRSGSAAPDQKAQVVTYAGDFVILSRRHAKQALDWTRQVMMRI